MTFERTEVADGVHRLSAGIVNFYVVEDGGKLTVVDAGAPKDWTLFERGVREIGRTLDDVEAVVLTHAHADHIGFAERARTDAGASIRVHEADAGVATGASKPWKNDGNIAAYLLRAEFYRTAFSLVRRGAGRVIPVAEAEAFTDGETIGVPGSPRVIQAPGHTPGTCALLLEDRRVLLAGDVVVTRNPLTGRVGPQIMPSAFNHNTPQAIESLDVLDAVPADLLLPGHGEPWTQGAAEAARAARDAGRS